MPMDTLCGDCKEMEYKYYYSFPHPEEWFWYCNRTKKRLTYHSGVRKDSMCPKLLSEFMLPKQGLPKIGR